MHVVKPFYCQLAWVDEDTVKSLNTPVQMIHGDSDGITNLEGARRLLKMLKRADLAVVPDTSHQVMQENPDTVNSIISTFINDLLNRRAATDTAT